MGPFSSGEKSLDSPRGCAVRVQDWGEGIGRADWVGFPLRLSRVLHRAKFAPDPEYRQGKTPTLRFHWAKRIMGKVDEECGK